MFKVGDVVRFATGKVEYEVNSIEGSMIALSKVAVVGDGKRAVNKTAHEDRLIFVRPVPVEAVHAEADIIESVVGPSGYALSILAGVQRLSQVFGGVSNDNAKKAQHRRAKNRVAKQSRKVNR